MAAALFIGKNGTDEFLKPFLKVRSKGIALFKPMSPANLRQTLEPVYGAFKPTSIEAIGCAYVMGLYGADVSKNVGRLLSAHKSIWNMSTRPNGMEYVLEAMPEAFGDIAIRQRSSAAVTALATMDADGSVAELAEGEWLRIWVANPSLWRAYVGADSKRYAALVDTLANAYTLPKDEDGYPGRPSILRGFATLRQATAHRSWADKLLRDVQAAAKKLG